MANSTQLISLPRKWAQQFGVKKGDELEIEEQGSKLLISTSKEQDIKNFSIDITGLDRTSILYCLLALYKIGYDEITITFNEPYTTHYRTNEKKKVSSVIHEVVNRLAGFGIIQQKENYCVIKEISEPTLREFDNALRRVFILLNDSSTDIITAVKKNDMALLENLEEKHNTIMKFVGFCLRILNKKGYTDHKKTIILYHIISNIDKIVDVLKYSARDAIVHDIRMGKEGIALLENIHQSLELYYGFFYKFNVGHVKELYEKRDSILKGIRKLAKKAPAYEILFLTQMSAILELLVDITEARIGLEYKQ